MPVPPPEPVLRALTVGVVVALAVVLAASAWLAVGPFAAADHPTPDPPSWREFNWARSPVDQYGYGPYFYHELRPDVKPQPEWFLLRDIGDMIVKGYQHRAIGGIQHAVDSGHLEIFVDVPVRPGGGGTTERIAVRDVPDRIESILAMVPNRTAANCAPTDQFCESMDTADADVRFVNVTIVDGTPYIVPPFAVGWSPMYVHNPTNQTVRINFTGPGDGWIDHVANGSTLALTAAGNHTYDVGSHTGAIAVLARP